MNGRVQSVETHNVGICHQVRPQSKGMVTSEGDGDGSGWAEPQAPDSDVPSVLFSRSGRLW